MLQEQDAAKCADDEYRYELTSFIRNALGLSSFQTKLGSFNVFRVRTWVVKYKECKVYFNNLLTNLLKNNECGI